MDKQFWYFTLEKHLQVRFSAGNEQVEDRLGPALKELGLRADSSDNKEFQGKTIKLLFTDISSIRKLQSGSSLSFQNTGTEMVYKKLGHEVYIFRDFAALIYSEQAREWKCYLNGNEELWVNIEMNTLFKIVVGRILSLVYQNSTVVGFYGVPVNEGVVILNAKEAKGEFVFFDVKNKTIYTQDGHKAFDFPNKILRLETMNTTYEKRMRKEELYSFLMARSTLLSLGIHNFVQTNAIKNLISVSVGIIFPEKSFKPRVSISS